MIGILIILVISAAILWFYSKNTLLILGIYPTRYRLLIFSAGFVLASATCLAYHLMTVIGIKNAWLINSEITSFLVISGIWWVFKSVLFEEFIFRGALLYITAIKTRSKTACLISSICFGIYHWFSYNSFGNPFQMAVVLIMTGFMGYALAMAFLKAKSMFLPIGLHLGWNILNIIVFSNGPLGHQIFFKANELKLEGLLSLFVFLFQVLALPLIILFYVNRSRFKRKTGDSN